MISRYFSLDELISSDTAARKHIDNHPSAEQLENLKEMAQQADRVREFLGHPMIVTSGFRSAKLNAAIGGSKTSSHMTGYAMDFRCPGFGTPREVFDALKKSGIAADQLLLEYPDHPGSWVHIGFAPEMRHQYLIYDGQYRVA